MRLFNALASLILSSDHRRRRATVALMTALAMPLFVGSTGLTVDIGLWFAQKTALQAATDAAAMKAARDLAENAATTTATLQSDAVSAANAASATQFNLNSNDLSIQVVSNPNQTDNRAVEVDDFVPGLGFYGSFAKVVTLMPATIHASSRAGIAYSEISSQATCYAFDSYNYLYSTGLGTIDTSHSSGIDPFKCGTPPNPPSAYNAYCNGGVLGCSLNLLNLGNVLVPFAFQLGPNGGAGGLNVLLAPVLQTVNNLLAGGGSPGAAPTVFGQGASCPGNVCTIPAGTYNGGITIGPNVSIDFVPSGGNHTFLIENGNFTVSTVGTSLAAGSDPNAVFFLGGAAPGAYVTETQVQINTAPITSGSMILTSTATFESSSLAGIQTSAPLSAMADAQQQAYSNGLLSLLGVSPLLGLPAENLVGTNFESVVATCPQATSFCSPTEPHPAGVFQSTLLPSLGSLTSLLPILTPINLLVSENEVSTTTITSGLTIANGVPTDWSQTETASSNFTTTKQTVNALLTSLGVSPTSLLGLVTSPLLQTVLSLISTAPQTTPQITSTGGVFANQSTNGPPSCSGQPVLYSPPTISPSFEPGFSDLLNTSGESAPNGTVSTTDTITICGTSQVANLAPISPGQVIIASTAGGASTISLLQ